MQNYLISAGQGLTLNEPTKIAADSKLCHISLILGENKVCVHKSNKHYLGRNMTKPVFRVSDIARFKPVSSATEPR